MDRSRARILFDVLRTQALFIVDFKTRDHPKRLMTSAFLTVLLMIYVGGYAATMFFGAIVAADLSRQRMFERLPRDPRSITDRHIVIMLALDILVTFCYCLPSLALVASGSTAALVLGLLWLSAVTIHNVAGLALVKLWCWAALVPMIIVTTAAAWLAMGREPVPGSPWDAAMILLGTAIYAFNVVEVTFRHRQNRNAFSDAQKAANDRLARLEFLSRHDALTGLLNRPAFDEILSDRLMAEDGVGRTGVIVIDLDGFKAVNDTYGHAAGDAVLATVAERIEDISGCGRGARLGGDEFAVLLDGDEAECLSLAGDLHARLHDPVPFDGTELEIGASLGVAMARDRDDTVARICSRADKAMYRAKSGRLGRPLLARAESAPSEDARSA